MWKQKKLGFNKFNIFETNWETIKNFEFDGKKS